MAEKSTGDSEVRTCSGCQTEKPLNAFRRNKARRGGYTNTCLECYRVQNRKHSTEYRKRNPTKQTESRAAWQRAHPASHRRRQWVYKHLHPEKYMQTRRRYQRMAGQSDGTLTRLVLERMYLDAARCPYCTCVLSDDNKTLDHKEPLDRGGAHSVSNTVVCCSACNKAKGDTPFAEWMQRISASQALGSFPVVPPRVSRQLSTSLAHKISNCVSVSANPANGENGGEHWRD